MYNNCLSHQKVQLFYHIHGNCDSGHFTTQGKFFQGNLQVTYISNKKYLACIHVSFLADHHQKMSLPCLILKVWLQCSLSLVRELTYEHSQLLIDARHNSHHPKYISKTSSREQSSMWWQRPRQNMALGVWENCSVSCSCPSPADPCTSGAGRSLPVLCSETGCSSGHHVLAAVHSQQGKRGWEPAGGEARSPPNDRQRSPWALH